MSYLQKLIVSNVNYKPDFINLLEILLRD